MIVVFRWHIGIKCESGAEYRDLRRDLSLENARETRYVMVDRSSKGAVAVLGWSRGRGYSP